MKNTAVERSLRMAVKQVFDANGITMPYAHMVVSNSDNDQQRQPQSNPPKQPPNFTNEDSKRNSVSKPYWQQNDEDR